jgi:hypothetical protein
MFLFVHTDDIFKAEHVLTKSVYVQSTFSVSFSHVLAARASSMVNRKLTELKEKVLQIQDTPCITYQQSV